MSSYMYFDKDGIVVRVPAASWTGFHGLQGWILDRLYFTGLFLWMIRRSSRRY